MPGTMQSSSPSAVPILTSFYVQGYKLEPSRLQQCDPGILYGQPLAASVNRLLIGDFRTLLGYRTTVESESEQAFDVMAFKILLPGRAEVPLLVASNSWTRFGEFIKAAMPIRVPISPFNLEGRGPIPPSPVSLEHSRGPKGDRALEYPGFS